MGCITSPALPHICPSLFLLCSPGWLGILLFPGATGLCHQTRQEHFCFLVVLGVWTQSFTHVCQVFCHCAPLNPLWPLRMKRPRLQGWWESQLGFPLGRAASNPPSHYCIIWSRFLISFAPGKTRAIWYLRSHTTQFISSLWSRLSLSPGTFLPWSTVALDSLPSITQNMKSQLSICAKVSKLWSPAWSESQDSAGQGHSMRANVAQGRVPLAHNSV